MSRRVVTPAAYQVETSTDVFAVVRRNPVIKTLDFTEESPAGSWRQHKKDALRAAQELPIGQIFAVLQRKGAGSGYWLTEWTVGRGVGVRTIQRRRAAMGATLSEVTVAFLSRLSYHESHYFRPEDGLLGLVRDKNKRKKTDV